MSTSRFEGTIIKVFRTLVEFALAGNKALFGQRHDCSRFFILDEFFM